MSSEKNLVLQASDISIVFGGLCAVSDASFDLYEGELIGLIGPNGAGKTTMFNMVSGIYTPTSGQLSYWDRENKVHVINKANPAQLNKLGIARTFQNIRLFGNLPFLTTYALRSIIRASQIRLTFYSAHHVSAATNRL